MAGSINNILRGLSSFDDTPLAVKAGVRDMLLNDPLYYDMPTDDLIWHARNKVTSRSGRATPISTISDRVVAIAILKGAY